MTFAEVAQGVGGKHIASATIRHALELLGSRAEQPLEKLDAERKLQMTSQFVRALRNVGVSDATRIEHDLYDAIGAAPTSKRSMEIKDAISLIAVRNHVAQLATSLGMPWSTGMQVQSAVSDIARFLSSNGGGRIETQARAEGGIAIEVRTNRPVGPVAVQPAAATPSWLIGAASLAQGFRSKAEGGGTYIQFWIALSQALVA